jgi:two-component system NtrC family sensor kinase
LEAEALESREGILASEEAAEAGAGAAERTARSIAAVPLRRGGSALGTLTVERVEGKPFSRDDLSTLGGLAILAAAALSENRLHLEMERHAAEDRLVTRAAGSFAAAEDIPALRRAIVDLIGQALDADAVQLTEVVQGQVVVTAVRGESPLVEGPEAGRAVLLCGHGWSADSTTHRCTQAGSEHLAAAALGPAGEGGTIQVLRPSRPFARHEEELLRRLTEIAGLALLTRLATVRVSRYADRIRSVAELSGALHQSLRPADAMSQAGELLRRALGVSTVRIALVDEARQQLVFPVDRRGEESRDGASRPIRHGVLEEVWRSGRTLFFPEQAMSEIETLGFELDAAPYALAVAPLRSRGAVVGAIAVEQELEDSPLEPEDVRILDVVAQQLGVTLDNLASLEEERCQRITAEWLRQMARRATEPEARPIEILELAVEAAVQGIGGQSAVVRTLAGGGTEQAVSLRGTIPLGPSDPRPLSGTIVEWIIEEQGSVFISADLARDPRLDEAVGAAYGELAAAAAPIWSESRVVGVLELFRVPGSTFTVAEVERLVLIADHAGAGYQTAKSAEALRQSEERYRRLISTATDAIFTLDQRGVITSFNEAAERLWDVRGRKAVGQAWQEVLPFETPDRVGDAVRSALAGASATLETASRRADGERATLQMTISPLVEEGETTAVLAIVRDVTDQRRTQAQLFQAEKMSAIGQLVGGMAHEINNPLASILVNMELLLAESTDPAQLETLQAVKAETDRAAQIVRNLLTYLRGQGSERALIDLRDAVQGAVALRKNQLANQQIEVLVDLPAEPVPVWGNKVNLQQVLMNLLINAEQAIRSAGGRGKVWIRLTATDQEASLTVDDDGPGIPPDSLTRIFDPFYTTKPEGEGTGLGLSVSAGIVSDHGGTIYARERPGGGARFLIGLPAARTEAGAGPGGSGGMDPPPRQALRGNVLVIDDEQGIRRSLAKFLTRLGWHVDLADSGEEGLRLLLEGSHQAVICDLRMPGMSGHEFYRALQASRSAMIERLVFMTGDVLSPEVKRFLAEAGRPVLSKPFTLEDLMDAMGKVLPA